MRIHRGNLLSGKPPPSVAEKQPLMEKGMTTAPLSGTLFLTGTRRCRHWRSKSRLTPACREPKGPGLYPRHDRRSPSHPPGLGPGPPQLLPRLPGGHPGTAGAPRPAPGLCLPAGRSLPSPRRGVPAPPAAVRGGRRSWTRRCSSDLPLEIINLRKAKAFDLRLSGTISVRLADGERVLRLPAVRSQDQTTLRGVR